MVWVISGIYVALLAWGFWVGIRQIIHGRRHPDQLLNPLFRNRVAINLFTLHIVVVSLDLFVIGPWAVANKSTLWYWGGRIALLFASLPIAALFNRNAQTFGRLIGTWAVIRNFVEYGLHIVVAAIAVRWDLYYLLLWWIVAYRYLDVGPRRALQKLYGTPEKKAARPWAPILNWAVLVSLYVATFVVVRTEQLVFATVPGDDVPVHDPSTWEYVVVIGVNLALLLFIWTRVAKYTLSLMPEEVPSEHDAARAGAAPHCVDADPRPS